MSSLIETSCNDKGLFQKNVKSQSQQQDSPFDLFMKEQQHQRLQRTCDPTDTTEVTQHIIYHVSFADESHLMYINDAHWLARM